VLRTLLDAFPTAVLVADDSAHYLTANRAACELLGRPSEQVIGLRVSDIVGATRREATDVQWQAFLRDGAQSGIFTVELPDGGQRVIHFDARANFMPGLHCSFMVEVAPAPPSATGNGSEELPLMCAWTKQMRVRGQWVSIEEYLEKEHHVIVSHGISPDAFEILARDFRKPGE
jgi:PAS domain S-box-containing protein